METEQLKILTKLIAVICAGIGVIVLLMMITDIIEFAEYIEYLESDSYSRAIILPLIDIPKTYRTLFTNKAVIWIPLFIMSIIILKIGKKNNHKNESSSS
ncbi:hypothetical protein LCGC14_0804710 [marine sediment metagenome]|uniref:Uncharacterized protein n=1 Tax=marine sediment metagenome TaxID=412755 RepID=A0A0F9SVT6_9ZZZZ|nr:hypothetical protein [archaeon]